MKMQTLLAGAVLLAASMLLQAENSQQARMADCNAQAKTQSLAGDDRKSFMKTCLSGQPAPTDTKLNSQQMKMKQCNADAKSKGLKGDDRKTFMSGCLKG
jgi:hypothetical protein